MEVKEVEIMPAILDGFKLQPNEEQTLESQNAKDFVKIMMLQEELEREKERLYQALSEQEKIEAFNVLRTQFNIPDFITVRDASEILEITPQMVRRYCADGKLRGHQTLQGSGKWRLDTEQFIGKPNWDKFIEKRARIKKQSVNIANNMLDYLYDQE
ncbi:helix-turn-helix domain-containing protein [Sporosarcina saromensis]|nr:helix-turn-helix domain-containing protein [Sporosarcina saromensis]